MPASFFPFLKDRRADGLDVTLEVGQNFAVYEEWKELPLQWKGEGVLKKGDRVEEMQAKGHVIFVLYLYLVLVAEE